MDKHDTLLISCSSAENRQILRSVLQGRYNLLEASNLRQMLLLQQQNASCIAGVLLDATSPELLDRALLSDPENMALMEQTPVILLSREDSPVLLNSAFGYGAADVIPLDYEPYAMLRRIETIIDLHLHKISLQAMVEEQASALRHSNETIVDALSSIIEYRSVESGQHILRIRHFTKILLEEVTRSCPEYQLSQRDISLISSAAALHDIGKIAIPDSILMKPGKLTEQERETMKTHALTGCHILSTLGDIGDPEYMRYAHNICHYHHERWDGRGYPEGLSGERIPICAQVVGLADCYDALTSKRVYKDAYSFTKAVNMILSGECGVFSPKLLECFKHVTDAYQSLAQAYADGLSPQTESFDTVLPPPAPNVENSLERVSAKYFALTHYINGLLIELDLNQGLFHLVYNPYPEMSWLQEVSSIEEMTAQLEQMADQEEEQKLLEFLKQGIREFMEQDMRRLTRYFRLSGKMFSQGGRYEITLLRINPVDAQRRTLAVLCRRAPEQAMPEAAENTVTMMADSTLCCCNDEDLTIVSLGEQALRLVGYSRQELHQCFRNRFLQLVHPEDRDWLRRKFREKFIRGTTAEAEFRVQQKSGQHLWLLCKARLSLGEDGQERLNLFLADISNTKKAHDELKQKLDRYEIILAQTENVLFEWDLADDAVTFSETGATLFGFPTFQSGVLNNLGIGAFFHPDDLQLLLKSVKKLENGSSYEMVEARIATNKGRYLWCRFRASALRDGEGRLQKVVGIIINIDEEKQASRLLQDQAERDSLTKLLNKNTARKQAEQYLSAEQGQAECAMIIIDLDNFKQVNDRYGHMFGDAVLTQAAREIEKMFRLQDIVARIGGDEFLVLMRNVSDRAILENRCSRLVRLFQTIFQNQKYNLPLSCSVGIAMAPLHGSTYVELFQNADQALYSAKAGGKNSYAFYDPDQAQFPAQAARTTAISNRIDSEQEPGLANDNIVRHAFQRLYTAKDEEAAINQILELVGKKMNVSRVYVFENSDDNRTCSNTYEWCNQGIEPEIHILQSISYETDIPGYEDNFNEQGIFYCPDIKVLPKEAYDILEPQGIKSMLQCAIREGGVFRGYIGFDECVEHRYWTKEQIQPLTYFSEMLSVFLLKQREQEKALMQTEELTSILDNQNAWIYIIDPDSCALKYVNAKTRQLASQVAPGMPCYRALMGKEERCPGCPALNIRQNRNSSAVMHNEQFQLDTLAEATLIRWGGEESCLLTCREIPKM